MKKILVGMVLLVFSLFQGSYTEVFSAPAVAEGCGAGYVPVAGACLCDTDGVNTCRDEPRGGFACSEQGSGYECRRRDILSTCGENNPCQCCRPIDPQTTSTSIEEGNL